MGRLCAALIVIIVSLTASADTGELNRGEALHREFVPGPFDIAEAEFLRSDSATPPTGGTWRHVVLPHLWPRVGDGPLFGWYRFRLPDAPYRFQAAVYLWRFSMNAAVWMNDEFLGDGGRFSEPVARNWNRPFLFLIPKSAWHTSENYLYIRLAVYPGWGNLPPIVVGPYDELRRDYEQRFTWQITFSQATFFVSLVTALVAFTLWMADRASPVYGIFGLTCLAWSVFSLNLFIQEIPVSAHTWWWLVHSSVDWYGVTLTLFAHRLLGLQRVRLDRLFIMFATMATLYYGVIDLPTLSRYNSYVHLVTLCITAYLVAIAVLHLIRTFSIEAAALATCMAMVVLFGIHDLSLNAMVTATLWQSQFFLLQFAAPLLMVTMLVILSRRFIKALILKIDAEQEIRRERERIYSDIHDDVGSRLLSLVYSADSESQAQRARETLQEVRSIVSGGKAKGGRLDDVLERYRSELQQRCGAAGIELDWVESNSGIASVSDTLDYHLQRVLRELVSNVIKHAQTARLDVLVQGGPDTVQVVVRDYGTTTGDPRDYVQGTGISNILRRVMELGGSVTWRDAAPGCRVDLILPLPKRQGAA